MSKDESVWEVEKRLNRMKANARRQGNPLAFQKDGISLVITIYQAQLAVNYQPLVCTVSSHAAQQHIWLT